MFRLIVPSAARFFQLRSLYPPQELQPHPRTHALGSELVPSDVARELKIAFLREKLQAWLSNAVRF